MQFFGKTKICCGAYALEELENLEAQHAFIATDSFMTKTGFVDQVLSHLDRTGITATVFDSIEPDPSVETIIRGTKVFLQENASVIIALGGGSAIDAAKAISFFAQKVSQGKRKPMLIAIPTTSGTGSEVTSISVITDKTNEVKIPLNDELLIPDMAILDARFTRTVPPSITAATGMDVLTHAIEAYTSRQNNPFTNIYAQQAISYVFMYLYKSYCQMDDMEAREKMQIGSCMAGMAFTNSGLGITHSIAHSLGAIFHIPHGLANAVLLPYVMNFNKFDAGVKYRELAELLFLKASNVDEGATHLIQAVRDLNASMNIPSQIRELKIEKSNFDSHLDIIAANALEDICTKGNPRRPSFDDIKTLLAEAW